ncbi:hypothetical protein pEaSNUABM29_00172 [Erwinia phage pEa_SNUABM_29]|nr:hypothetical protein pEaSNUABM29_00172 [Erwinia phage pEa_SNUABM_29]
MTQLYYCIVLLMWICLYYGVRHTIAVIRQHALENNVTSRTLRVGQMVVVFGVLVVGGLSTAGLHTVYTLHQIAVSGVA